MKPSSKPPLLRHGARLLGSLLLGLALAPAAWAEVREVRVGVYANEPKIMQGADGRLSGILGELLGEIARQENWRLQPVPCDWQRCLELTQSGAIDLMPDVAFSEARAALLDFHRLPALFGWSQLYSREEITLASVLDLQGRRIAVLDGSIQQDYLKTLLDSFGLQAELIAVHSLQQGFERVALGQADVAVANQQFGDYHAPDFELRSNPIMFQPARLFYATGKGGNGDLLAAIDRHLQAWQAASSSVYYQILQRWGGERPRLLIPTSLWWGLASLSTLLLLALGGALLLRRQVAEKTRHLYASEARLNTILDSIEPHVYIKDREFRYQYLNRTTCELLGQPAEQAVGQTAETFFDSATAAQLREVDTRVLEHGERVEYEEILHNRKDGSARTYLSVKLPLRDAEGDIYALCGISTDISEHKQNLEQIHRLAFYDPLTGLANRRLLLDRLQHALAQTARNQLEGALLFIDLDNFKDLNDSLGHDSGDQLLRQVAERLRDQVRAEDTLARLGGDEFVLVLEGLSLQPEQALQLIDTVASKLLQALAAPFDLPGYSHVSTASIGVALFSECHGKADALLKHADLAMYKAKAAGRNTLRFFNHEMQTEVSARAKLESDLRQGLRERQFVLHYQAQVDQQGQLLGAEALVRWQHPSRGLVAPAEFIPLAESTGLILPLGRWILHRACRQLASWATRPELAKLSLAVNISARQLHHRDFVADVLATLEETGANPACLELELTESLLVEDVEAMIDKMGQLKAHGVRFSLDDFGTGYSSLSYLKRLPLNQLKIDRSFVRDLLSDRNDAAIVRTIVALGSSLDLHVIAEGVETRAQLDALLHLGCQRFQGYLFAKPGPAQILEQWPMAASASGA
ncbi:EAL domain-containing protein [Pseudomonas sp. sp1636]|uniref:EAL domain-containing protein n=1 Tax=Pseudomonas sp. sp1636 TaxID=3036707 RepID=UPI0025A66612|nr:EAL domain-containing protein [Pseudomonas sp. sp1636]MDM8348044.1 EAL domain-containing protein [Pseudomonas sp. sp1636]